MKRIKHQLISQSGVTQNLPIFLESSVDEMGVMVGFDGNVEQVEQLCNFTYTQTGSTVQVYNSVNPDKFRKIVEQTYTISWGDGSTSNLSVNLGVPGSPLPTISHTYSTNGTYEISISLDTPWTKQKVSKKITTPKNTSVSNPLGTYIYTGITIPYENISSDYYLLSGRTQNYLNDLDYTNTTGNTTFSFAALGKSRISEKKKYGSNSYVDIITGTTSEGLTYTGYTIDNLFYRDFNDGITVITGSTSNYYKEEVFNKMVTRNEHFIGFIDDPIVYSDVFVERGKQGVLENNFRLGEIDNIGEMQNYGNGFFTIRKQ